MALPESPSSRGEQYLAKVAGQDVAVPDAILSRMEQCLAKMAGQDVDVPDANLSRVEQYLAYIAENGGGSSVTVEPLTVTHNGTQTAPSGKAYSPVTVNVPNSYTNSDEGKVVSGGSLVEQMQLLIESNGVYNTTVYDDVVVDVGVTTLVAIEDKLDSLTKDVSPAAFTLLRTNLPIYGDLSSRFTAAVRYQFNGIPILLNLFNYGSYNSQNVIAGMAFDSDGTLNGTVGAVLMWSDSGLIRADALMNGQLQDLLSYASQIDAVLVVNGIPD